MNNMISVTKRLVIRIAALYGPAQDLDASAPTARLAQRTLVLPAVEAWRIPAYRRRQRVSQP